MGISEKLAYLYETKEQIKSALKTPYNVYRDYATLIEKYVKNQPKSIVEGSSAICENAVDLPCNIDINGNSYQETTEGYNILNPANLGVINTNKYLHLKTRMEIDPNTEYSIVSNKSFTDMGIHSYMDNGNYEVLTRTTTIKGNRRYYTFTTKETTKTLYFYAGQDTEYTTVEEFIKALGIMLIKGTDDKPYEPFTNGVATPNTNHKQDIEVIDGVNRFPLSVNLPQKVRCTVSLEEDNFIFNATGTDMYFGNVIGTGNAYTTFMGELIDVSSRERVYLKVTNAEINKNYVGFYDENKISLGYYEIQDFREIPQNAKYCAFRIGKLDSVAGETYSTKIMVSFDDLPYLPYGHIGLVQRGKNIFDGEIEPGTLLNGNNSSDNEISRSKNYIKVKPSTQYTFSLNSQVNKVVISFYDKNKIWINSNNSEQGLLAHSGIFTTPNNCEYIKIRCFISDLNLFTTGQIQIEEGSVVTNYEPYIEPKLIPIDLAGEKLAKVGDIADLLNIGVDGSVKIGDKVIKEYVFTGDESLSFNLVSGYYRIGYTFEDMKGDMTSETRFLDVISNYFRTDGVNGYSIIFRYKNQIYMYSDENITTLTEFKNWLKQKYDEGKPVKVMYEVVTPQTIELPSIEPIELFEGTNVFELVTNLGTTLKVEYIVNAETLQNEIKELTNAVIELGGTL